MLVGAIVMRIPDSASEPEVRIRLSPGIFFRQVPVTSALASVLTPGDT